MKGESMDFGELLEKLNQYFDCEESEDKNDIRCELEMAGVDVVEIWKKISRILYGTAVKLAAPGKLE
jgi:O6-methylguanine-DNA--protein-cysteine methyltransferase